MAENTSKSAPSIVVRVGRWALVAVWAGVIVFLSSNTGTGLSNDFGLLSSVYESLRSLQASIFGPDVDILSPIGHFLEYALLSFLLVNALWQHMPLKKACLVAVLLASAFGITDEIHQYFVPERTADPLDWVVDTLGAIVGAALAHPVLQKVDGMLDKLRN